MGKYSLPNPEPGNAYACLERFADALREMLSAEGRELVDTADVEIIEPDLLNKPGLRCIRFVPHGANRTRNEGGQEQFHHFNIYVELEAFTPRVGS
ncbi:hypothetical protein [Streptomyces noursei]|uniref:hypothetical protein n=2 Tax=Streptomyces noursei TaxID=1971 RepID=UPI00045F0F06|nr:hypothetical protein [Streptomyces noursei]AIA03474.1 hypothetical protein DC74_2974 [Streptomyces noursei]